MGTTPSNPGDADSETRAAYVKELLMENEPKTVAEAQEQNFNTFMDQGPGLSYNYSYYVLARDTKRGKVLLGGLGGLGVGRMWCEEQDHHRKAPGYYDAPDTDSE